MAHSATPSAGLTLKINKQNLRLIEQYFNWVLKNADLNTKAHAAELAPVLFIGGTMQISRMSLTQLYRFFVYATTQADAQTIAKTWELIILVDDESEGKLDPPPNGEPD